MNYSEVLQKYLLRIARGELNETSSVLPLVKAAKIYLPQVNYKDENGIVKVTFPTVVKEGHKLIPIYLSRSNSATYSGTLTNLKTQLHDPIELKGETLFQVLPIEYGIIIEPSSSLEVLFDKDKLHNFIEANIRTYATNKTQHNDVNSAIENQSAAEESPSFTVLNGGKESKQELQKAETELELKQKFSISKIQLDLKLILTEYPSIIEGYILEHSSPHSELILGLLAKEWLGDERFRVIESVAVLAKQVFGYAGAIEVYDDLNDTHSSSWDLFKSLPPFYTTETNLIEPTLSEQIEITPEKRGIRGSMSKLTKSGFRLFSGTNN